MARSQRRRAPAMRISGHPIPSILRQWSAKVRFWGISPVVRLQRGRSAGTSETTIKQIGRSNGALRGAAFYEGRVAPGKPMIEISKIRKVPFFTVCCSDLSLEIVPSPWAFFKACAVQEIVGGAFLLDLFKFQICHLVLDLIAKFQCVRANIGHLRQF